MQTNWLAEAKNLSDTELLTRVQGLAHRERETTAALVASLSELDKRCLYLAEGCSSTFTFCTEILHLSEHAAYNRIVCARAARRFPIILDRLADGSVHLTAVRLLSPHLTAENHLELLAAARHLGKRAVEVMVAGLRPLPDVPATIRKLPDTRSSAPRSEGATTATNVNPTFAVATGPEATSSVPPARLAMESSPGPIVEAPRQTSITPLSPGRYRVQFTAGQEMHDDLQEARELLRHQFPDGDPARVLQQALKLLVKTLRARKHGACGRPQRRPPANRGSVTASVPASPPAAALSAEPTPPQVSAPVPSEMSRRIPTAVRRVVWNRDGARCTFRAPNGHRCSARGMLEYHHAEPFAVGGATSIKNITLRCRAHNAHEARIIFGGSMRAPGHARRAPQLE